MLRPKLVFWLVGIWILRGVMLFLVTIPTSYLACVLFSPICITAPTTAVRVINGINSKDWDGAFNFSLLVLVVAVFLFLLSGLENKLKGLQVGRFKILVSRLGALNLWIFYWALLEKKFGIFSRLLITSNLIFYLLEYWGEKKSGLGFCLNGFFY